MRYRFHTRRNSLRLRGYDYTRPGGYFVTLGTFQSQPSLSRIIEGKVHLTHAGQIAESNWLKLPLYFVHIHLDEYVFMPNHMHAILLFTGQPIGEIRTFLPRLKNLTAGSLSVVIRTYKSMVTKQINRQNRTPGAKFWHPNYYDRIIRNREALRRIRAYIRNNPLR